MAAPSPRTPNATDITERVANLERSIDAGRKEHHISAIRTNDALDKMAATMATTRGSRLNLFSTRKLINTEVSSSEFVVPIGPGAEKVDGFERAWLGLMKSHLAYKHILEQYVGNTIYTVNFHGAGPKLDDNNWVVAIIKVAASLGKAKPICGAGGDESDDDVTEPEFDFDENLPQSEVKRLMKEAVAEYQRRHLAKLTQKAATCWGAMTAQEQSTFIKAFLEPKTPLFNQIQSMFTKARSEHLYPAMKQALYDAAGDLVPVTTDVAADGLVYIESKKALDGFGERELKWPRMNALLCGYEGTEPSFYHTKYSDEDGQHEPSPFVKFVHSVADMSCGRVKPDKITPSLIAFCAFLAGQIATTSPRTRGHKKFLGVEMHTNLKDRDEWNAGITTALKFMKDRKQCPTHCPMLMEFQRDKKRKQ